MPSRRGQHMQKGHRLSESGRHTHHTVALSWHTHTSTPSSVTPTFPWWYWSGLTTSVRLDGCSINPVLAPQEQAGCCDCVAGGHFPSEGIVTFGAFVITLSHSRPLNADVSRYTGKARVMQSRNNAARLNRGTTSMQRSRLGLLYSIRRGLKSHCQLQYIMLKEENWHKMLVLLSSCTKFYIFHCNQYKLHYDAQKMEVDLAECHFYKEFTWNRNSLLRPSNI